MREKGPREEDTHKSHGFEEGPKENAYLCYESQWGSVSVWLNIRSKLKLSQSCQIKRSPVKSTYCCIISLPGITVSFLAPVTYKDGDELYTNTHASGRPFRMFSYSPQSKWAQVDIISFFLKRNTSSIKPRRWFNRSCCCCIELNPFPGSWKTLLIIWKIKNILYVAQWKKKHFNLY